MWLPDALRGLALLNMLAYHAMYDWVYVFAHASSWYDIWSPGCHLWQQYICWSFILLSGYSFTLSRRPLKNGLLTAAFGQLTKAELPPERIVSAVATLSAAAGPACRWPAAPSAMVCLWQRVRHC